MKTKAIIFDKDGTLLDFDAYWLKAAKHALSKILKSYMAEDVPSDEVMSALGVNDGITSIKGALCCGTYAQIGTEIQKVLTKYGHSSDVEDVIEKTVEAFDSSVEYGEIKPTCENLGSALKNLKNHGLKLYVVTTDNYFGTEKHLKKLGIRECFDFLYTDDGEYPAKPDPYCIEDLCAKEGYDKSQIVMVGDTLTDVHFAKNGGIKVICVSKSEENTRILEAEADKVVSDVSCVFDVLE